MTKIKINFTIEEDMVNSIDQVVRDQPAHYSSRSHFCRAAVVKELRRAQRTPEIEENDNKYDKEG